MIFVTVGTDTHQFDRLLIAIDELIENKTIKEKVIAQIGNSNYTPKNYESSQFLPPDQWEKIIKKSNLVISHGGAGSIMTALVNKKPLIVVPRLKKYDEHVNDHQLDIAKELEKEGKVIAVYDIAELDDKIKEIRKIKERQFPKSRIPEIIESFVEIIT